MAETRRLRGVNVTMLLCDSAQVADGKLYILGGGWSVTGPMPVPSAVAIKLEVDWHELSRDAPLGAVLGGRRRRRGHDRDARGRPARRDARRLRGRPARRASPRAHPSTSPWPSTSAPCPLAPASRYTWRFVVDGESLPGATVSFATRPAEEPATEA